MPQHVDRASYYARIDKKAMTPLWESLHALVPAEPVTGGHAMSTMATFMQVLPQGFVGKT